MDIWQWVEEKKQALYDNGHYRLVDIIDDLPGHCVNSEHDKVDALAPEALALARQLNEKWLEVFIRHWHLQSLVLHRHMPRQALADAVSLLEFSHRDDTRECPQSICAVQDLANCYGCADGPGYYQERLDVASETLDRIDPSWPCYSCIGAEYAGACRDAGEYEKGIEFLDQCDSEMLKFNQEKDTGDLLSLRIDILIRMGQLQRARELLDKLYNPYQGESFKQESAILSALLEASDQQFEAAEEKLPDFHRVVSGNYKDWLEVFYLVARSSQDRNNNEADYYFSAGFERLVNNGSIRDAVTVGFMAAELALLRGHYFIARHHADSVAEIIPQLYRDLGASEQLQALRREIDQAAKTAPATDLYDTLDALHEALDQEDLDFEDQFQLLTTHLNTWPDDESLNCRLAEQLQRSGKYQTAARTLRGLIEKQPDSPAALLDYGFLMLNRRVDGDLVGFCEEHLARDLSSRASMNLNWLLGIHYDTDQQYQKASKYIEQILQIDPSAFNARLRLSRIRRDMNDYPSAADHLDYLIANHPEDSDPVWDRLVIACLQQDWDTARELAARLEFELDNEQGEFCENWEYIRARVTTDSGDSINFLARRTGPVTATICGISRIDEQQVYGDKIVFDPLPLNRLDQEDEEGNPVDSEGYYTLLYPAIATLSQGNYITCTLDGVHPGEEFIDSLLEELEQRDIVISRRSTDEYRLYHEASDTDHPAVYIYLLINEDRDFGEICTFLDEKLSSLEHPLVFPEIASRAGNTQRLDEFRLKMEEYGIEQE